MRVCLSVAFAEFVCIAMIFIVAQGSDLDSLKGPLAQAKPGVQLPNEVATESVESPRDAKLSSDTSLANQQTLDFVRRHQAELADLLEFMRAKQPSNYQTAIRQISRTKQRLDVLSGRDKELYAIELELWKINSQLRLLAARMSVAQSNTYDGLLADLKKLVVQEQDLLEVKLQLERTRSATRLQSLDAQLDRHKTQREEMISKSIKTWETRAEKQSPKNNQAVGQK